MVHAVVHQNKMQDVPADRRHVNDVAERVRKVEDMLRRPAVKHDVERATQPGRQIRIAKVEQNIGALVVGDVDEFGRP